MAQIEWYEIFLAYTSGIDAHFAVFWRLQFQLATSCSQLISFFFNLILRTLQYFLGFSLSVKAAKYINDWKIPFFLFIVPNRAYLIAFKYFASLFILSTPFMTGFSFLDKCQNFINLAIKRANKFLYNFHRNIAITCQFVHRIDTYTRTSCQVFFFMFLSKSKCHNFLYDTLMWCPFPLLTQVYCNTNLYQNIAKTIFYCLFFITNSDTDIVVLNIIKRYSPLS